MKENQTSFHRDFKGVWIPKEIWLDKRLNALEKCILVEIDSLDNANHCYASNKYLAELMGCSEWKIGDTITKLKKLRFIKQVGFDGRKRFLQSLIPRMKLPTLEKPEATSGKTRV